MRWATRISCDILTSFIKTLKSWHNSQSRQALQLLRFLLPLTLLVTPDFHLTGAVLALTSLNKIGSRMVLPQQQHVPAMICPVSSGWNRHDTMAWVRSEDEFRGFDTTLWRLLGSLPNTFNIGVSLFSCVSLRLCKPRSFTSALPIRFTSEDSGDRRSTDRKSNSADRV